MLLELLLANRDFFAPYEPERPPEFFTLEGQRAWIGAPDRERWLILDGVDAAHNGRGLATRAVAEVADHAFGALELHRLEAGTRIGNHASQRVLEKNRFERIGVARRYLLIAGEWVDHVLFQRVAA